MSMPKSEIIIGKGGKITIEGIDKSNQLFNLNDLSSTVVNEEIKVTIPYNAVKKSSKS